MMISEITELGERGERERETTPYRGGGSEGYEHQYIGSMYQYTLGMRPIIDALCRGSYICVLMLYMCVL